MKRVRTEGVKVASLSVAKEASVFSPCKAGSRSYSCQLLYVNLLFSAHPAPLQPIQELQFLGSAHKAVLT